MVADGLVLFIDPATAGQYKASTAAAIADWELSTAAAGGLSLSEFRFAISFVSSILVNLVLKYVRSPTGRHLYSFTAGVLLCYYPFGSGCLMAVPPMLTTYVLMRRLRQHCGTLTWLTVFPYLILNHVLQASGLAWKAGYIDFTGAQMILTLKLIAAAQSYQDGLKDGTALRDYARKKALTAPPSVLEWVGYCFGAGNLLAGPFLELKDYLDWARRSGEWDESARPLPSPWLPGLARFAKAVVCAAAWLHLSRTFNAALLESRFWQAETSVLQRVALLWMVGFTTRLKYYFAWAVAETGLIFNGLCFNGYDSHGRPRWTRYINARLRRVETSSSLTVVVKEWNIGTSTWLRHYVYDRLTPRHSKPTLATLLCTQLVSGVWHGLFPGYWLCFATSAFMLHATKLLYKYEQGWPERLRHSVAWRALKSVWTAFLLNYTCSAFVVLTWADSIAAWRSVAFAGHLFVVALVLFGMALPPRPHHRPARAEDEHHHKGRRHHHHAAAADTVAPGAEPTADGAHAGAQAGKED